MKQRLQQLKDIMNNIKMAQNPQLALNQLLSSSPELKQAFTIINQYGGDPQKAFYAYAQQMGIDPEIILQSLSSQ